VFGRGGFGIEGDAVAVGRERGERERGRCWLGGFRVVERRGVN
jgi:hypothetical protein